MRLPHRGHAKAATTSARAAGCCVSARMMVACTRAKPGICRKATLATLFVMLKVVDRARSPSSPEIFAITSSVATNRPATYEAPLPSPASVMLAKWPIKTVRTACR